MLAEQLLRNTYEIEQSFLDKILKPYHPTDTDYLKSTHINLNTTHIKDAPILTTIGRFNISRSCYIKDTGHFNAVEFLICFNQLAYATFGHMINSRFFDSNSINGVTPQCKEIMANISIETYFDKQLSSMLILKTTTRFKRTIDAKLFTGMFSVNKFSYKKNILFISTSCIFRDDNKGYAEGDVLLAYPLNFSN